MLKVSRAVQARALNPSALEAEAGGSLEFKASLIYKESSRTAREVTQRNPVFNYALPPK